MSNLLDELRTVEAGYNGITPYSVEEDERFYDVELVSDEFTGDGRWENYYTAVFRRLDEYVALDYSTPATEIQEGQDQSTAEFYEVRPVEVTVTKYEKV